MFYKTEHLGESCNISSTLAMTYDSYILSPAMSRDISMDIKELTI